MEHIKTDYCVLLYYCFTPISNPEQFRDEHHLFCISLNLRGRIIVAAEGLNGTVSGKKSDCQQYMDTLKADPRFKTMDFKIEESEGHTFKKINVRLKSEIVHAGLPHIKPYERTGKHLSPAEFKALKDRDDVVILDVRSDYEHQVGRFKNAVTLDIQNFREFPEKLETIKKFKDKKILTYCTGGIKCEKASAYLLENGFEEVYQLHGGIVRYGIEEQGYDFEGKCYVFDERITAEVNTVNPTVVSKCIVCGTASERMINCANPTCNKHAAICENCGWEMEGACSTACKTHPEKRPYDGTGIYSKKQNGYNPRIGWKMTAKHVAESCKP
ncbi:MAG: rhodanese-related sulfurtransferase [Bernardetiaceae bacterium]|nr:rhodanese-related sulfurtransferase [Bernardetiaceae bacterium]